MHSGRGIRMWTVALLVVIATLSLSVSATNAAADPRNRAVTGQVTGTSFFDFFSHGCGFVYQRFDLSYVDDRGGVGTLQADTCGDVRLIDGALIPVFEGPFELVTGKGAVLTGDLVGAIGRTLPPFPLEMTLTVESGTKSFANSEGTVHFVGTWFQESTEVVGSLTGELTR